MRHPQLYPMSGKRAFEGLILAHSADDFNNKLTDLIANHLGNLALNLDASIMAIQFKDADEYDIAKVVDSYRGIDGQYCYQCDFMTREEVYEQVKPYCKYISISVVPKDLGKGDWVSSDRQKKFGYINLSLIGETINPSKSQNKF